MNTQRNWIYPKRDPLCSKHRAEMHEHSFGSLTEYFDDALADNRISEDTKQMIRDWKQNNVQ